MDALSLCENPSQDPTTKILDVNGRYSYGNFMFQMGTWLAYSKRFGTTVDNIGDPILQRRVARYMLDHGGWSNWYTCYKKTVKLLGYEY